MEKTKFTYEEKEFLAKAIKIHKELGNKLTNNQSSQQVLTEKIPEKEIITYKEAKDKYGIYHHQKDDDLILVFKGSVHIKGTFNDAWLNKQLTGMTWRGSLYGMLILGDLVIQGDLIDDDYIHLFVKQNLQCDYIFSHNGFIDISGNANVLYGIYGEYNDGSLQISGSLHTPYLIAGDHDMPRRTESDSIYIEGSNGSEADYINIGIENDGGIGWGWRYFEDNLKLLSPATWNDDETFSVEKFFELVRNGKNPFVEI